MIWFNGRDRLLYKPNRVFFLGLQLPGRIVLGNSRKIYANRFTVSLFNNSRDFTLSFSHALRSFKIAGEARTSLFSLSPPKSNDSLSLSKTLGLGYGRGFCKRGEDQTLSRHGVFVSVAIRYQSRCRCRFRSLLFRFRLRNRHGSRRAIRSVGSSP